MPVTCTPLRLPSICHRKFPVIPSDLFPVTPSDLHLFYMILVKVMTHLHHEIPMCANHISSEQGWNMAQTLFSKFILCDLYFQDMTLNLDKSIGNTILVHGDHLNEVSWNSWNSRNKLWPGHYFEHTFQNDLDPQVMTLISDQESWLKTS